MMADRMLTPQELLAKIKASGRSTISQGYEDVPSLAEDDPDAARIQRLREEAEDAYHHFEIGRCLACHPEDGRVQEDVLTTMPGGRDWRTAQSLREAFRAIKVCFVRSMLAERDLYELYYDRYRKDGVCWKTLEDDEEHARARDLMEKLAKIRLFAFKTVYADGASYKTVYGDGLS
jgi:hypothetical protein